MFNFPGYADIELWYKMGFWTDDMVKEAVKCSAITADQYKEITGKDYAA